MFPLFPSNIYDFLVKFPLTVIQPSRWCLHFVVVGGLAWSKDPESYAGGSIATGRVSNAGLVEGDGTD
jgi:hypothetical protein